MSFQAYLKAMGRPWGQLVGCSVLASSREQPFHAGWIQRRVYLNGGVAGDGRGDAGAHGFEVFPLGFAFTLLQHLNQHALQLIALEPNGGGLDGDGARAEGFGVKAVALQFVGRSRAKTTICCGRRSTSMGMSRRWRWTRSTWRSRRIFSKRTRSWATC